MQNNYFELADTFGSTFYIFDSQTAKKRVSEIKSRLSPNARLCYAVKANAFLIDILKDEDLLFEVCSPGELSICERVGLSPAKIVFSGVMKTSADVERAFKLKVNTITLESPQHCKFLLECAKKFPEQKQDVILRLTNGNQFGMTQNDLYDCVDAISGYKNIHIRGIHFFTGTQKSLKKVTEEISFIEDFCAALKEKFKLDFTDIEYGPGLSYNYFSAKENEGENYSVLEDFTRLIKDSQFSYVIESGRFIAAPCGKYVSKIADVKDSNEGKFCIIDGGINHINYFGQMMGMKIPPLEHLKAECNKALPDDEISCTIAGSLCTTADIVVRKISLNNPQPEDLLVFKDIGAYSVTESMYLFLSHPLPAVLISDGKKIQQVRGHIESYELNYGKNPEEN